MKNKTKVIIVLFIIIILSTILIHILIKNNYKGNILSEEYRSVLTKIDYKNEITYVIGHKSPDSDTVGSAISYAYFLNQLGIKSEAAISGTPNKETSYALNFFNIKTPQIIDDATEKQFVLVDHSEYSQAINNMDKARIVGIIDHHGIGNVTNNELIYVRSSPMGSTASIIYYMYKECAVEIPKDIARVMLMSLISDTSNGTKKMTKADYIVYDDLVKIADVDVNKLYNGMIDASLSYEGMTDKEIFNSDYKEYEIAGKKVAMGDINAKNSEKAKEIAKQMYKYMEDNYSLLGMDILLLKIDNNDETSKEKSYMIAYGQNSVELLKNIFNNYDGNILFVFDRNISRKADIIPAITKKLESNW